jgi:hypothetical protein
MRHLPWIGCAAGVLAAAAWACQTTPGSSTAPPAVQVVYSLPTTIEGDDHFVDGTLVGRKQVGLQFTLRETVTLESIVLSRWAAGNNAGAQSQTFTLNQTIGASASQPVGHTAYFEIPGGASFEQCEGLYYTFGAVYRVAGESTNALFLGQPRLILPTKKRVGNTIEQALCAEPPPADA